MTDKLTPGQLRDLAHLHRVWKSIPEGALSWDQFLDVRADADGERKEAARREAVDFGEHGKCVEADKPCESDRCLTDRECYAPPPPADDLVARLRQYRGKSWEVTECYNGLRDEAAAAIEALRAREKALVVQLQCIQHCLQVHGRIDADTPVAWSITATLAAGGGNG